MFSLLLRRFAPLLALAAMLLPAPAQAWWEYGHYTVANIALANVKPQTREKIMALLRQGKLVETPTCPLDTLANAAYWADCVKELGPRFSYQYNWHYQNIDICKPFTLKGNCPDGNCVSAQIDRAYKLLADKHVPTRERIIALANLAHFVGDLHQPLHAGDHADRGGNDLKTDYGIATGKRMNIHSIWDGLLAERSITTPPSIIRVYSPEDRARLSAGTTEEWSQENWEIAKDVAYKTAIDGDPCAKPSSQSHGHISEAEIESIIPVMQKTIVKGGLRLARLLDQALAN
jgi:hypothetical protein